VIPAIGEGAGNSSVCSGLGFRGMRVGTTQVGLTAGVMDAKSGLDLHVSQRAESGCYGRCRSSSPPSDTTGVRLAPGTQRA